jgi:hypothetical protein
MQESYQAPTSRLIIVFGLLPSMLCFGPKRWNEHGVQKQQPINTAGWVTTQKLELITQTMARA